MTDEERLSDKEEFHKALSLLKELIEFHPQISGGVWISACSALAVIGCISSKISSEKYFESARITFQEWEGVLKKDKD